MKTKTLLPLLALVAGFIVSALPASAHDHSKPAAPVASAPGRLDPPTAQDAAWLVEARKTYPLKTCVISQEELGGMGEPAEYIYRRDGQPDRLVRFCCSACVKGFKKDPAAALKRIDDAARPAAASAHH